MNHRRYMYNTDLVSMIKTHKQETGLSYPKIAERIGISKTTLEYIVYGIREGKESTREKIYNYISRNNYEGRIKERYEDIKSSYKVVEIHKSIHNLLGLMYVVVLYNEEEDRIEYKVLLEKEV